MQSKGIVLREVNFKKEKKMLVLLCTLIVLVVGILLQVFGDYDVEDTGSFITIIGGVLFFMALVMLPCIYCQYLGEIVEFESMITSIENARLNGNELENAAIQHKIIEANKWIASKQFWNKTIWDWYIPDAVMDLESIK